MSIASVVTMGYGSFGSVNLLPTLGYSIGTTPLPGTDYTTRDEPADYTVRARVPDYTVRGQPVDYTSRGG